MSFRAEIDELRARYEGAIAAGDYETVAKLLAPGAVMVRPDGAEWDAMAAAASGAPFPPNATIKISPLEVVPLSSEWAYEFGTAVTTYQPPNRTEPQQLRDTYLILLRRTDAGWQAYREVASSTPPPQGWPSSDAAGEV